MDESINFINRKINDLNIKIEKNIDDSVDNRGYMFQNIIKSLRDLVEYIAFKVYVVEYKKYYVEYNHVNNRLAIKYIKSLYKHEILKNFHALLEIGPSHNSYSEDGSIRLMVKYQEYLVDLKRYYFDLFKEKILTNLYKFPMFKIDPSLYDYYKEIYNKLIQIKFDNSERVLGNAYYIKKTKPVAIEDRVFYELTLTPAIDYVNKFNRIIFYSPVRIPDNIIFSDGRRFSNVLYNNLKGKILKIEKNEGSITFELFVERRISDFDAFANNIKVISREDDGSVIEIKVLRKDDDDKDDEVGYIVPFTVSYATSIHKSQGLEFDSVKIIISDESEELITKNIFYTAITRSKNHLKIYWSPECQNKVIKNMKDYTLKDDVIIIKNKMKN